MKNLFNYLMVVVMALVLVGCNNNADGDYRNAVADDALVVARFDINQVLEKSGMKQELMSAAAMALAQEGVPQMFLDMTQDLNNSGIDVKQPAFAYCSALAPQGQFIGVVAKVSSRSRLDNVGNYLLKKAEGELIKSNIDGCTVLHAINESDVAIAYNDVAIIIGGTDGTYSNSVDVKPILVKALKNTLGGSVGGTVLPAYEGHDIAACVNMSAALELAKREMHNDYNPEVAQVLAQMENLRGSTMNAAFNFAAGSIDYKMSWSNLPDMGLKQAPCTNENLKYVPMNALVVANIAMDGNVIMSALKQAMAVNPQYKELLDDVIRDATNGTMNVNSVMPLVEPLVRSIKGDLTASFNNISQKYDYYSGGYDVKVDAAAMVNVVDRTILTTAAVPLMAAQEVTKIGNDSYSANIDGITCYFGQQNNALFAATPSPIYEQYVSAKSAAWYPAVQNTYGYVVANISAMLQNGAIRDEIESELGYSNDAKLIRQALNTLDYVILTIPSNNSIEMRLVFVDERTNSLQQLVNIVAPAIMREMF